MISRPKKEDAPKYQEEKRRGDAAKVVPENEMFKEATTTLRDKLLHDWLRTAPDDVKGREWFHQQALAQQAFINNLTRAIQTGEMAKISLGQIEPVETPVTRRRRK